MKKLFAIAILLGVTVLSKATVSDTTKLYNPAADADADIKHAIETAAKEGKHVLIQAGGNWCGWCIRFNNMVTTDPKLDSAVKAGYVVYHLNYSKENKNAAIFRKYGFAQRFGFPVFIILDGKGNHIHTQNSAYLEEGKGYSKEKVLEFLQQWSPAAFDEKNYRD